jgi:hypothetical protein
MFLEEDFFHSAVPLFFADTVISFLPSASSISVRD